MKDTTLYHEGSRQLQDRFQTRRLADPLEEVIAHDVFTDADRAFIESRPMFFLATADAEGRMQMVEESPYAPHEGHTPPVPEWKTRPVFREVLPPTDPAAAG